MKGYIIALLSFMLSGYTYAQTEEDLGRIVMGVDISQKASPLLRSNEDVIRSKLLNILSSSGFATFSHHVFTVSPNIIVEHSQPVEAGMKQISQIKANLHITIQDSSRALIFASNTYSLQAYGNDTKQALRKALGNWDSQELKPLLDEAKLKILEFYRLNKQRIFAQAEALASSRNFDAAIACLLSIPTALEDVYLEALNRAKNYYAAKIQCLTEDLRQAKARANDEILVKARTMMLDRQFSQALELLSGYQISGMQQDRAYQQLISEIDQRYEAYEKGIEDQERERMRSRERLLSQQAQLQEKALQRKYSIEALRIRAITQVATEYIRNNPNSVRFLRANY